GFFSCNSLPSRTIRSLFEHPNARSQAIDERLTVVPKGETEKTGKGEGREDPPFALGPFPPDPPVSRRCRPPWPLGRDRTGSPDEQTVASGPRPRLRRSCHRGWRGPGYRCPQTVGRGG